MQTILSFLFNLNFYRRNMKKGVPVNIHNFNLHGFIAFLNVDIDTAIGVNRNANKLSAICHCRSNKALNKVCA